MREEKGSRTKGIKESGRKEMKQLECVGFPTQLQIEGKRGMPSWGWRNDGVKGGKGCKDVMLRKYN